MIKELKAYILVGIGFALLTYWYFWLATIADLNYVLAYVIEMFKLNFNGQVVPLESLSRGDYQSVMMFGPDYDAIAPEVVRAFEERQHLLPYVFLAELVLFVIIYFSTGGRKEAKITQTR